MGVQGQDYNRVMVGSVASGLLSRASAGLTRPVIRE
jgi:hypothetical protein